MSTRGRSSNKRPITTIRAPSENRDDEYQNSLRRSELAQNRPPEKGFDLYKQPANSKVHYPFYDSGNDVSQVQIKSQNSFEDFTSRNFTPHPMPLQPQSSKEYVVIRPPPTRAPVEEDVINRSPFSPSPPPPPRITIRNSPPPILVPRAIFAEPRRTSYEEPKRPLFEEPKRSTFEDSKRASLFNQPNEFAVGNWNVCDDFKLCCLSTFCLPW